MTLDQILQLAGLVAVAAGPVGSLLEGIGTALKLSWLVAIGQRLEALGMDLPKMLRGSRATAMLKDMGPPTPKTGAGASPLLPLLLLAGALGLAPALTSCASRDAQPPGDASELVSRGAALAYTGAAQALLYFDQQEAAHAKTLNSSMVVELAASEKRVQTLEHGKAALDIVRGWLEGKNSEDEAKAGMRDGVAALKLIVAEARNQGHKLPTEVDVGLAAAEAYVGSL